jgi:hypothetical protein
MKLDSKKIQNLMIAVVVDCMKHSMMEKPKLKQRLEQQMC